MLWIGSNVRERRRTIEGAALTSAEEARMRIRFFPVIAAVLAAGGCDGSPTDPSESQIREVRRLTEPFRDVAAAQAAGYTVWSPDPTAAGATCASSAQGRMGYHLVNVGLRGSPANPAQGDAVIDYRQPEMLLYEKRADGTMNLVGVEYLVFREAWERVHGAGAAPPTVLGQTMPLSTHSFVPGGPEIPHYELHVWLHSQNPNGMFSDWNPSISC
jgi:hypothetical protein